MRVKMQLLNSPLTVMKLAREMDKLYEVGARAIIVTALQASRM